jgi:hypothetical protein
LQKSLLIEHGIDAETSPEQAISRQAVSFSNTSAELYFRDLARIPTKGMSPVPFVVNAVFALELYIKTLAKLPPRLFADTTWLTYSTACQGRPPPHYSSN